MKSYILIIYLLFASLLFFQCENKAPEKNENKLLVEKASMDEIEAGIKKYITEKQKNNKGIFHLETDTASYDMRLVRVHTEFLSNLGPGKYFACVDLAVKSGDVYDVDFFLEGTPGNMSVTRTSVHKLNGKPYYTWKQNKEDETWSTVAVDQADNTLLGVIEEKDSFNFYYTIKLPKIKGEGKLWIPIAQSNKFQKIKIIDKQFPVSPKILTENTFGNKAFYIELNERDSDQEVQINYAVRRLEKSPYASDSNEDLSKYLKPNTLIPVNEIFKNIALTAIGNKTKDDTLIMARALYDYVIDSMKYIKDGKYGTGDAVYACDAQSGNCSEFHSYFIALARSIGIPARFGIGAAIPSSRNKGGVNGYHCWAEFYTDGQWWPVDISEANKYSNLATYYFGHHPANRIAFSQGRDITFDPLPASGPIYFFAYPVMEVDGGIVRPEVEFSFLRP